MVPHSSPLLGRNISLTSETCSYCSPDRRCFKTLFWEQTIFTSHQVKQLLNGRGHLWMSDQRILRYQVVLMENPHLTITLCEVLNHAILLPTPEGSLSVHSCLMPLLILVITILILLMIAPCIINRLTCFFSAQANKLQYGVPVQHRYIILHPAMKNTIHLRFTLL